MLKLGTMGLMQHTAAQKVPPQGLPKGASTRSELAHPADGALQQAAALLQPQAIGSPVQQRRQQLVVPVLCCQVSRQAAAVIQHAAAMV